MLQQTTVREPCIGPVAFNLPRPTSGPAEQMQNENKGWELVQDDSLKEDYLMVWPAHLLSDWEVVE